MKYFINRVGIEWFIPDAEALHCLNLSRPTAFLFPFPFIVHRSKTSNTEHQLRRWANDNAGFTWQECASYNATVEFEVDCTKLSVPWLLLWYLRASLWCTNTSSRLADAFGAVRINTWCCPAHSLIGCSLDQSQPALRPPLTNRERCNIGSD